MATFGTLRTQVLAKAQVTDHFRYLQRGPEHVEFWNQINHVEYERGYTPAYLKLGSPALCDMELLTDAELEDWLRRAPC